MTDDKQFRKLEELFSRACELNDEDRSVFLDTECAGNAELRAKLARMLEHASGATAESPLGFADSAGNDTGVPADRSGETVGHYRLVRLIGQGGMGEVYEAEQTEPVRRTVAVKLLSSKWLRRKSGVSRRKPVN